MYAQRQLRIFNEVVMELCAGKKTARIISSLLQQTIVSGRSLLREVEMASLRELRAGYRPQTSTLAPRPHIGSWPRREGWYGRLPIELASRTSPLPSEPARHACEVFTETSFLGTIMKWWPDYNKGPAARLEPEQGVILYI